MSRRRRLPPHHVSGLVSLLATIRRTLAEDLPYNPTRIFHANSSSYAYILQPDTDAGGQAKLVSVDVAQALDADDLDSTTLYATLPFLSGDSGTAILSIEEGNGNITVVAGDCTNTTAPQIWTFVPASDGKDGNGTWTERTTTSQKSVEYLSGGVAFSQLVDGNSTNTDLYMFGGMCPWSNSTTNTWTTAADYTNRMLQYVAAEGSDKSVTYSSDLIATRGPPVAEAGFSMTPLTPSYTADGTTTTQAQSFVLLGGHTDGAFINMSQVALFSLPLETWSFLGIDAATDSSETVEPRSGHSAVLSEDGSTVVIFGGWVGDISTPATPQLAVLELGSGYGGSGNWTWSVPTTTSANLTGAGLYGHGALMLPGSVMMISGGYSIPNTTSSSSRMMMKRATSTSSSQTLFYNVTSSSWVSSYSPPASAVDAYDSLTSTKKSGTLSTTGQKAGLGIGLVIGVILLVALILYFGWYTKRVQKKKKENRMSDKEKLVKQPEAFDGGLWNDKVEPAPGAYSYLPQGYGEQALPDSRRDVERSGVMVNIPSPTRGLRKNGPTRAQYQYHAAPRYEDGRISRSSGHIHPIEERDEEEDRISMERQNATPVQKKLDEIERLLRGGDSRANEDPFQDPAPDPLRSHPVSPEIGPPSGSLVRRSATSATNATNISVKSNATDQVSSWISQWTASYAASMRPTDDNPAANGTSSGHCSPTKTDDRTASTLSELSDRSGISAVSSMDRTSSTRSALFFGLTGRPSTTPQISPVEANFPGSLSIGRRSPMHSEFRSQSGAHLTAGMRPASNRTATAESYGTANTTWGQLMEQGGALLGSTHPVGQPSSSNTIAPLNLHKRRTLSQQRQTMPSTIPHDQSDEVLLANAGPAPPIPPRRRLGWMGSLRKALKPYDRSFSSSAPLNPHHADTSSLMTSAGMQHYRDHVAMIRSASTSPSKTRFSLSTAHHGPRRTASDSSEYLRLKRGRHDWEGDADDQDPRWAPYRDEIPSPDLGDWGEDMVVPGIVVHHYDVDKPLPPITGPNGVNRKRPAVDDNSNEADDWDVEQAIAKRDVQVLFTLPKARLRVVNADPDSVSQRSVSGGSAARGSPPVGAVAMSGSYPVIGAAAATTKRAAEDDVGLETDRLDSFHSAQAGAAYAPDHDGERGSDETPRTSGYSKQIVDWEREGLERKDRDDDVNDVDVEVVDMRRRR